MSTVGGASTFFPVFWRRRSKSYINQTRTRNDVGFPVGAEGLVLREVHSTTVV